MPDAKRTPPADPQVLAFFHQELARTAAPPGLAAAGSALWPRFAGYYQGLARLPRRLRRALQRRWRRSLGGIALLCALGQPPALAATIFVDGAICTLFCCTLVDAITAANNDAPAGVCDPGSGADDIRLPDPFVGGVPPLTTVNNNTYGPTGLPVITSTVIMSGSSSRITRDSSAPPFRILAVGATGNLTLEETRVSGGVASSGSGGGILNRGALSLRSSRVSGNSAGFGGGIGNTGTLTVTGSYVSSNSAESGGGIGAFGTAVTLTNSFVLGNTADGGYGGGISADSLTLVNSTFSGNSAAFGGGGISAGPVTLIDSTVSGNTAGSSGGGVYISSGGSLTNSTVSGNTAVSNGGGISSNGTTTLAVSTVEGNTARNDGGGIFNFFGANLTLTNSTVSANSAQNRGGGIFNAPGFDYQGTHNATILTLTNSTVSGNTAADRGGGVENNGTVTFTNSTVTGNASGRIAGSLFNTGTVTLVQSLLSGNTAPVIGPEAYSASGIVIADGFNLFGHDGFSGVAGFTLGATDLVPAVPLPAVLDPTLGLNGGPTRTHALVFGSPAVDAVPGAGCATGIDQRGAPRPQDADGDTISDCDIGAVERGLIPIQAAILSTTLDCRARGCRVSVRCNLLETECRNPIDITVRSAAVRAADGTLVKAPGRIRFAAGVTNIPPGGTQTMRLPLTPRGTRVVRTTERKRLQGLLAIREILATATNTPPATISNTRVTLRLRRR